MNEQQIFKQLKHLESLITSSSKRWISLSEAISHSNKSKGVLIQWARENKIKGFKSGDGKTARWTFDRHSIDNYLSMLCDSDNVSEIANEIMNSF